MSNPPAPPLGFAAVPSAPLPISGRPSNTWVGSLIALNRACIGDALAASAAAYAPAPAFMVCMNWAWKLAA
ncbi:hypothetical protein LAUMK40_04998 [Mycobacterium kansasii]|nr:hypothetical protein LAUMK40_04998 [Mycobacterium kansasii]